MATKKAFGKVNNETIYQLSITNQNGVTISCLSYGANWYEFLIPTKNGAQNLILNFPHVEDYINVNPYLSMSIGRTAGRIGKGQFTIDNQTITVPQNERGNTLHGGPHGFANINWDSSVDGQVITFKQRFTTEYDGYPGNLDVTITYTLTDNNEVLIDYTATSDANGVFNPTNHAYFNLNANDQTIKNMSLKLLSNERLELDNEKIPTGHTLSNSETAYDFSHGKLIGAAIDGLQNIDEKGFDDAFVIAEHQADQPVAILTDEEATIAVEIYSKRNGIIMFTANKFGSEQPFTNRTGQPYVGVALESQMLPSAIFDPAFGDISIKKDETKHLQTRYVVKF